MGLVEVVTDHLPGAAKGPAVHIDGDRRDLRLDACRGLALWFIFLDHIPDNALAWLTLRKDQALSGWLIIAMNVRTVSVGRFSVFRVEHDDRGLWLSAGYGHPESFWGSDKHFVFVRPVSSSLKV